MVGIICPPVTIGLKGPSKSGSAMVPPAPPAPLAPPAPPAQTGLVHTNMM